MKNLILEFKDTGPCIVDVDKVVKAWSDEFSISRWHDEYRLIKGNTEECAKVTITEEQAKEIIQKAELCRIKDSFFVNGSTYRSKSRIESELIRFKKITPNSPEEKKVIDGVILSYQEALL